MSEIQWSPTLQHDGSAVCPESARGIRTQVKQNHDWDWLDSDSNGEFWPWHKIVCYRIPMEDYRRIYGDSLATHPDSEIDADQYSVVADSVNRPAHYVSGGIECIDAIKAQMTPEQYAGYLRGNVAKYLWRYEHKGGAESLRKASWYLDRLIAAADHG